MDDHPRTPWHALAHRRYLRSAWPWRAAGYLAGSALTGIPVLLVLVLLAAAGATLSLVLVGLPLLALLGLAGVPVAAVERRRLRLVDRTPTGTPHRTPAEPGLLAWARLRYREQATWRELAYAVLHGLLLWWVDLAVVATLLGLPLLLLTTPLQLALAADGEVKVVKLWLVTSYPPAFAIAAAGAVLLPALLHPLGALAGARAALTRALLAPRERELQGLLAEVTRSRARLVDAFEAERRRIERDLHDGAQQRLVALTMTLGLARLDAPPGPLADRLATAHDEAGKVLAELRELIHGIHPQVLTDYGLTGALADAAERSAVPVDTDLGTGLPRLPESVEAAAYFAVCEALANIGRHSGAARAAVTARHTGAALVIAVTDDGRGGADPAAGSGLTGLADRIAVLDGTLAITSPPGGPTVLSLEIPCPVISPTSNP
ncbi:histidine kinase [Streptomyces nojiriensis]|uniref:histidine kinase n=1 Tax=Streptomyces nojiriensis TaxID=66374 RepID=A0ABQ3SVI9_9ACTN|nr:sensor histidine kinase [Streptomyces nojiriensis]QTI45653.1 Sensor histidine kinase ComP [Streptomyces nojiriensis]GGR97521.1 histidine kinase [Streptomyces nojiriensis]GHI72121.1 histidine kinase [Streptomyces nojiriensis]